MYGQRRSTRPIYGSSIKMSGSCLMKVPPEMDINTYLSSLSLVLGALEKHNNKTAAIENIQIIETRITNALAESSN
jgi:hypothetical protein